MKVTRRTGSLVIVLVIFAAIVLGTALAAIAIDKSEIPMLQQHAAEAAVTADGYTHGSNIGRQTSGNAVSSESQLVSALNSNGTYYLTRNITLTAGSGGAFSNTRSFSGTLYGNGHTVTIEYSNGSAVKNANQNEGGLVSTLTGRIYDLNVVLSNTTIKRGRETTSSWPSSPPPSTYNMGIIAGYINGGTVENCTVTIKSGVTIWAFSWRSNDWASFGTIAGRAANNANITNCTTVNNGEIKAGAASDTSVSDVSIASENSGSASNLVGYYEAGNYTIDNIVVSGNGYLRAFVSSPLGILSTAGISIHMTNFYDKTTNSKIINGNNYWSYTFLKWTGSPDVKISNLYRYGDTQHHMNAGITPGAEVKINRSSTYSIYFDPKATNTSESLVVVKSGVTGGANYSATIKDAQNNSYSDGHYAFNSAGNTVVFRNLPTAASNWSSGGNFTCTINITQDQIEVPTMDPPNKWEHGYVSADTTTSGTAAISSGTDFERYFSRTGSIDQSGTYYLKDDIVITGFTGKEFSGTLDGNGHTIFITAAETGLTGKAIGGLVGKLTGNGIIKNLRVVIGNNVTVGTTATGGDESYPMIGGIVGYLNGGTLENVQVVVPSGITFATQQFSSTPAFGGMVGEMNGATLTKVTAVIDGTLAPYGSYVWAAALVGKQAQNRTASTLTDVIVRGQGAFNVTSSNSGGTHEDAFLAAVTVFQESSNAKRATVDGVIVDFKPTLNSCDCYGIFTNNYYDGGASADYSNVINASNIYVLKQAENRGNRGNKAIDESAVTKTIATTVQDRNDIPVTAYFPASENGNLVLVAGDGTVTVPNLQYANAANAAFNSTVDGSYKVITVAKNSVTNNVSLNAVNVSNPTVPTGLVYSGQSGIEISIGTLTYGVQQLTSSDYTVAITANDSTGSVTNGKPVNAGAYTLTVTMANTNDFTFNDNNSPRVWSQTFNIARKTVELSGVTAVNRQYDGSTNVTVTGGSLSGVIGNDNVTFNLGTGTAAQANVGTGISVTVNVTLEGAHAANYVLQSQPTVKVNITPKVLSITDVTTSFPFANTEGTAITDQNLTDGATYSLTVEGFVGTDSYTLTVADVAESSYITERTAVGAGSKFLKIGTYTVTLIVSNNYIFSSNNTFTFAVTKNASANTWITEYARGDWTYYSDPADETMPVARFGSPAITYSNGNEGFSNTTAQGEYTVNVSVAETENYGALLSDPYTFTVSALDVTVALSAAGTVYDGQAYEASNILITLTATVNGTETTYTSKDNPTDVSTLLGSYGWQHSAKDETETGETETKEDLPTDAGTYTLYICNYSSNKNVNVTGTLECTATISPAEVKFGATIKGDAKLVYGTVPTDFNSLVDVTVTSGGIDLSAENWSFTVKPSVENGEYTAKTHAGKTVTLTVTITMDDPNHSAVQPTKQPTLVIQKADIGKISVTTNFGTVEIELDDGSIKQYPGFVYDQAEPLVFSGIPKDLTVKPVYTYAVQGGEAINNFDILTANSGIYTVTVSITGDTNYNDKTEAIEFAIAQGNRSVTVTISGWTYGDIIDIAEKLVIEGIQESDIKSVTYSGTTNAGTEFSSTTTVPVPTEAGKYTVTVKWDETTNYTAGSAKSAEFIIERAPGVAKISVNDKPYKEEVTSYYTGSEQIFKVTVEGHDGGAIDINGTSSSTMNYKLKDVERTEVNVTVAQTANYTEATATAIIEISPAVIQSVTLKTTAFDFGTLNTENADDASTYRIADVAFVNGDGSPEFIYSLAYNNTVPDNDVTYISVGTYTLTMKLTDEPPKNFKFVNGSDNITAEIEIVKVENTWTSEDKIDDYPFGFAGKAVTRTAKFGTEEIEITYYRDDVKGQADKGDAIEFSFDAQGVPAGTYTAVVSVPANGNNYDEIFYEDVFVVKKHRLNITELKISGTEESGTAGGFTVTYAPEMGLSAKVTVGSADGYNGKIEELLGSTRTYLFERSTAGSNVWTDGLPKDHGTYTVRFKGMELEEGKDINNFAFVYEGNATELTTKLTINKATVSASAELNGDIVYGMTVAKIKELVSVSEGVSMKDVAVTYINESGESVGYSETTQSGTKLTITVTVEAEDDNYTVDSDTVKLEKTVQKAKLTVTAEGGSAHSATFVPDNFKAFDRVEAKWGENPVEASEYPKYLFIELTGYSGEVAGDPETNFGNGEIGVYTFTVKLTDEAAKNFLMVDAAGAEYEGELTFTYTLATEKVTLTVKLEGWTYGDAPNDPTFTVKDADGNSIGMQTIGHYISVKYEGINGTEYDFATAPTEAGDYIITAAITGHTDYVAEEEATKEFTIGKRPIALVLSSDSASEYYDRRVAITDFTSVFGEYFVADDNSYAYEHALKDVFTLTASSDSGDVTEIKNAGSYKITAKLINDNYVWATDATSPEFIYKIDKAIVTIQMAYKEANIYDGEPVDAPVLSFLELPNGEKYGTKDQFTDVEALIKDDEELMAILRAITVKYGIGETPIDAGEYTFTAVYPGNDNYADADYQGPFTIGKADIGEFSIEVSSLPYTGEHLAGQTPVMTGGNPQLEGEELSETVSYFVWNGTEYESVETATNVGQYKIVRTSPESNNYHGATAEFVFTISPATVTIEGYTDSYGFGSIAAEQKDEYDYVITLTASVSADYADKITYSTELIGDYGSEQGYLNVGSYTLKIVLTNGNYAFTEGAGEIAIEIVPSENKFVSVEKRAGWIYGNKPADINVSVAYGSANIVTYDSEGNVVELSAATYAGSYYDVVTIPASEFGNYAAIEYAGDTSFVIGKATFKWSWKFLPDNIVYGDSLDGAFVINEPEVTGGIESDFVYFVYNTNAVYSVGGEVYSYDPQTDAGTVVTISAQCVWSDETPEGIKTSYVIDPDEFGAIAFNMEVQKKPIAVTAVSLSDIYGSAFDPTGDANEYFGGAFLYNGAPITNLTAQNSVVVIEISGSGLADDRLNAGNYTVTVSVGGNHYIESAEDGTLENGCVSVGYTVMPKTLNISDGIKSLSYEFGMLSPEDLNASDAILNFIGGANGLFDGLAFGDSLTAGDFTLSAAQDYSAFVSEGYMIVSAEPYIVNVALSATSGNYIAPETGLDDIGIYVVKAANRIYGYSVPGWTYLDVLSEYIPSALPSARFGVVEYGFFAPDGSEMTMDKFNSETPAGTYSFRFSVQGTDNYDSAVLTGEFVVDKLIVIAELTATDVTYDGAVYDGISYTLSFDVSDYIGTVGFEYSENGSAFRKGLPTDAGNYSVRIGEYSDSENIELRAETVDFQINPAPMHFTVKGVDGASIEYGTAIADIDVNALIVSVIPDSYVGGFEFTVSLITANGSDYRPGLYAGTTLYATVDITLDSNNYYPVVDTAIEMLPKVNITKVSHDMAFEISDEIITDGSSAAVIEGSANTVIDAISYYMAINDIQYYEYHITVDGEEYSRNFVWAPGSHTVEVRLSGNHEGSTQFTVVIEENPDAVDRAPFTPKTVVGEVLESINFTWASAVSIAFGVAVAVLIILFFGLRRAKRK